MPATRVPMTQSQWKVCPQTYKHPSEYFEVVASNECISTLFFPLSDLTHMHTHTHRRIVLHYESRTSYAITSDNNTNDYPLCVVYWLAPECALNRKDVTSLFPRWMNIFGVECWSKHKLVLFLFIPACIAYDYMHEYLPFKSKSLL